MKRKAEMRIGTLMVAGEFETVKDKVTKLYKWRFSYNDDNTRHRGQHVFDGLSSVEQCRENAELMGVEFSRK